MIVMPRCAGRRIHAHVLACPSVWHRAHIHQRAAQRAVVINTVDLSAIRVDCTMSFFRLAARARRHRRRLTYCYLLPPKTIATVNTWAVHLLDLKARGLNPHYTIADAGAGLRAGQNSRGPGTPFMRLSTSSAVQTLSTIWARIAAATLRREHRSRLANPPACQDHPCC